MILPFVPLKHKDCAAQQTVCPISTVTTGSTGSNSDGLMKDVLKFVIGDFDDRNQFQMKARKVIIYYYDQQDFELKVINLITLFGRDIVEKNMDDNKIIFIKIDSNID